MNSLSFWKMNGCGNDFIVIDNRDGTVPADRQPELAVRLCRRRLSVGADGLILVENSAAADFVWRFFNSDGSRAEMCGNGARCVARFAQLNAIAPESMSFETLAGRISARVDDDRVRVRMTDPTAFREPVRLNLSNASLPVGFVDTGVPHAVIATDDVDAVDVEGLGREIRRHPHFAPAGANANFFTRRKDGTLAVRTYERGVETETLACGTGAVACALTEARERDRSSPVAVLTRSGGRLRVHFRRRGESFSEVELEGDARIVYRGHLSSEAWSD